MKFHKSNVQLVFILS